MATLGKKKSKISKLMAAVQENRTLIERNLAAQSSRQAVARELADRLVDRLLAEA